MKIDYVILSRSPARIYRDVFPASRYHIFADPEPSLSQSGEWWEVSVAEKRDEREREAWRECINLVSSVCWLLPVARQSSNEKCDKQADNMALLGDPWLSAAFIKINGRQLLSRCNPEVISSLSLSFSLFHRRPHPDLLQRF